MTSLHQSEIIAQYPLHPVVSISAVCLEHDNKYECRKCKRRRVPGKTFSVYVFEYMQLGMICET